MHTKLLALSLWHDASMSYFDGEKLNYLKMERAYHTKRFGYDDLFSWVADAQKLWGLDLEDLTAIALVGVSSHGKNPYHFDGKNSYVEVPLDHEIRNYVSHKNMFFVSHHYSHALSTWVLGSSADINFVIDGVGDSRVWSVYKKDELVDYGDQVACGSIGMNYAKLGRELNIQAITPPDTAGKLMGLQAYGSLDTDFLDCLRTFGVRQVRPLFDFNLWVEHKGSLMVAELTKLDYARTITKRLQEIILSLFEEYASPEDVVHYSGGVAQNVDWNTELKNKFPNLRIAPHAADDGLSLGAIEWLRKKYDLPAFSLPDFPYIQCDTAPDKSPSIETIKAAADALSSGKIVAWYQGHGEVGPRALGNRSIFMDPRLPNGKTMMNAVKRREDYRPFGASILSEFKESYFLDSTEDLFMQFVAKTKNGLIPAVTHVDGTCRVQTVPKGNSPFRKLLEHFYAATSCPVILNTSLNLAGKPIAGTPEEAIQLFNSEPIDMLVIGDKITCKT